jgi:hypothetical protein
MEPANSAKKKKGLLDWQALGEGRRVYDGPVTKNQSSKHQQERLKNCSFPAKKLLTKGWVRVKTRQRHGLMWDSIRGKGRKQWGWMGAKGGQ